MNPRTDRSIGVIDRYRNLLPVTEATPVITLGEGSTPLIESAKLAALMGKGCRVFLKFEGANPTGSFKDRGMTVAVSLAAQRGARTLICASTGNTSAAAAAYAARGGMRCAVLLPAGKIAAGKIAQAFIYGATVIGIDGNFDACLNVVRELQKEPEIAVVNSINPDRLEGQKTAAFEVVDELSDAPAIHILPVGNAGNIAAYWNGYQEYRKLNRASRTPRMLGFQAAGAAPIFFDQVVPSPETSASAIRIGNPASWGPAKTAVKDSGGAIDIVSDEEIFSAQRWLAANEGVFAEPASAASVAGFLKCAEPARRCGSCPFAQLPEESNIVLTLTGHGLKDVAAVLDRCPAPLKAEANKEAVLQLLS
ncbi:MAG TPA: threonine synthase [Chthoniobacterales bacterium]|nr:threonine synthase [Chthoniobacterales bacterium]